VEEKKAEKKRKDENGGQKRCKSIEENVVRRWQQLGGRTKSTNPRLKTRK